MSGFLVGTGRVVAATKLALRVELDDTEVDTDDEGCLWVPRSFLHEDSEIYDEGHSGELIVKEWAADKLGPNTTRGSYLSKDRPKPQHPVPGTGTGKKIELNIGPLPLKPPKAKR